MPTTLYPFFFFRNNNILAAAKRTEDMSKGFIKLQRSEDTLELLLNEPNAFLLLSLIALRAKRNDKFNAQNLGPGEALIGDDGSCGLTSQKYRTAKEKLEKWNFVTFKITNRGTIAKLVDNRVWDINCDDEHKQNNKQETSQITVRQQADNSLVTPNKEHKEVKEDKKETTTSADAHGADFSFDPVKAKAMLEEFWNTWEQTPGQQRNYLKKGIGHCFAALRHISDPSFTINKTAIAAFVWAFTSKPWLEKANQPKPMSNRERIEQNFVDGESYNQAMCTINSTAISFHRGMKMGGANFDDKTFMSNFSKVLDEFGIENPFKIKLDNVKEA